MDLEEKVKKIFDCSFQVHTTLGLGLVESA